MNIIGAQYSQDIETHPVPNSLLPKMTKMGRFHLIWSFFSFDTFYVLFLKCSFPLDSSTLHTPISLGIFLTTHFPLLSTPLKIASVRVPFLGLIPLVLVHWFDLIYFQDFNLHSLCYRPTESMFFSLGYLQLIAPVELKTQYIQS